MKSLLGSLLPALVVASQLNSSALKLDGMKTDTQLQLQLKGFTEGGVRRKKKKKRVYKLTSIRHGK